MNTDVCMADEIIGIAILDNSVRPRRLYALYRKHDGQQFIDWIPCYDYREAKPCDPCWRFQIDVDGKTLHFTPSVWWRFQMPPDQTWHDRFHNSGQWSVAFQYAVPPHSGAYQVRAANGMSVEDWE